LEVFDIIIIIIIIIMISSSSICIYIVVTVVLTVKTLKLIYQNAKTKRAVAISYIDFRKIEIPQYIPPIALAVWR